MNLKQHASVRQSGVYRMRVVALLSLLICTIFPASLRAQDVENPTPSTVTILSQTQTPDGVHTTLRVEVDKDSFLSSRQPNSNFGGSQLRLGWSNGDFEAMRILIEFNISSIPRNAVINSATLFIFQTGTVPGGDRTMDYRAQFMRSSWSESGVTWNNANFLGGDALPLGSVDASTGWKTANVTNLVRTWYSRARPNNGLIVTGDEIPANNRMRQFASREQRSAAPYIILDFTTGCDTIAPNASVNALPTFSPGTFRVSWSGTDSAPGGCNPSGIASFDVDYRINGSSWHNWNNQTQSTSADFRNWANNGDFVEFRSRATDNAGNVQPRSNPQTSTRIDTEPPSVVVSQLPPTIAAQFFTLAWSGTDNLSGVAHYDVQWRENGGDWGMLLQESTQTFYQITGAQSGVTYDFRIRATDNVGNSAEWPDGPQTSTTVSSGAVAKILPFNPSILKPSAPIRTSFAVNWTGAAAPGAPITSYIIFYQFNRGTWQQWQIFPGNQTSAQFPFPTLGLGDGAYGFEAIAVANNGQRESQTFTAEATILVDLADTIQPSAFMPAIHEQTNALAARDAEDVEDVEE